MNLWEENKNIEQQKKNYLPVENVNSGITSNIKLSAMPPECVDTTMQKSGIYKIVHRESGKFYIGSTKNFKSRWEKHKYALNANTHVNCHLQNAWNKYGESAFDFMIIEHTEANKSILLITEQQYLNLVKLNPECAFNLNYDSSGGEISEESKEKIRLSKLGEKNPMYGTHRSEKLKQKLRRVHKGNKYCLGRKLSNEHKEKIRIANIGKIVSENQKIQSRERIIKQMKSGNINNIGANSSGARPIKVQFADGRVETFECIKYLIDKYPDKKYNNIQKLIRKEIKRIKDIAAIDYIYKK